MQRNFVVAGGPMGMLARRLWGAGRRIDPGYRKSIFGKFLRKKADSTSK